MDSKGKKEKRRREEETPAGRRKFLNYLVASGEEKISLADITYIMLSD